jgi:hypothetical protein
MQEEAASAVLDRTPYIGQVRAMVGGGQLFEKAFGTATTKEQKLEQQKARGALVVALITFGAAAMAHTNNGKGNGGGGIAAAAGAARPKGSRTSALPASIITPRTGGQNGNVKLADLMDVIPQNTPNTFAPSSKYPDGFKYQWTHPATGETIKVWGHPSDPAHHPPGSWTVRIGVGSQVYDAAGSLVSNSQSTHATTHHYLTE